jgi:quercetin 2,3-dioxygenase
VSVVACSIFDAKAPSPPPDSWASRPETHVAIWTLEMAPGARFTLPAAAPGLNRTLYFFAGRSLTVADEALASHAAVRVRSDAEVVLENGPEPAELLVLQGKPIAEPVVQHGPFVMNTRAEIQKAMADYRTTRFGGWPWPSDGPVHAQKEGRFARHADGRVERRE